MMNGIDSCPFKVPSTIQAILGEAALSLGEYIPLIRPDLSDRVNEKLHGHYQLEGDGLDESADDFSASNDLSSIARERLRRSIVVNYRSVEGGGLRTLVKVSTGGNSRIVDKPRTGGQPITVATEGPVIRESLESLVDGAVSSLVHDSVRLKHIMSKRKKRGSQTEDYRHDGRNILTLGYTVASQMQHRYGHGNCTGTATYCRNMAPGVQCLRPNSSVFFAKSSSYFRSLHSIVGDSLTREILLNTILLIPYGPLTNENYFQLCGPPLNHTTNIDPSFFNRQRKKFKPNEDTRKRTVVKTSSRRYAEKHQMPTIDGTQLNYTSNPNEKVAAKKSELLKVEKNRSDPNRPIPRYQMFYCQSYTKKIGLPASHILNNPSTTASQLLDAIFHLYSRDSERYKGSHCLRGITKGRSRKRKRRWNRLRDKGIPMCSKLQKRHHRCDYPRLLERHCPLPPFLRKHKVDRICKPNYSNAESPSIPDMVAQYTPVESVVIFVTSTIESVIPKDFWGTDYNFNIVKQTLKKFLELRRFEQMPEKAMVHGIRINDVGWLTKGNTSDHPRKARSTPDDHKATSELFRLAILWVYTHFVIPLLRCAFYITESEFSGNRILFYRKPLWSRFRNASMRYFVDQGMYRQLNKADLQRYLTMPRQLGLSRVRLLPKKSGVRSIAQCISRAQEGSIKPLSDTINADNSTTYSAKGWLENRQNVTSNVILRPILGALTCELKKCPGKLGSGLIGISDFHPRYASFVMEFKDKLLSGVRQSHLLEKNLQRPPLYFVSMDIHRCYDNIKQTHLFELVKGLLNEEDYLTQQFSVVHPFESMRRFQKRLVNVVSPPEAFQQFDELAYNMGKRYTKSLFCGGTQCSVARKEDLINILREHIFQHVIVANGKFGPRYLLQTKGIPQGSILGTALCNLYYGDMERKMLHGLLSREFRATLCDAQLLVRIVDDFLLITSDKKQALKFIQRMNAGIPELGVAMNKAKTVINFDAHLENEDCSEGEISGARTSDVFPWCGLVFDTATCEVKIDYSRFSYTKPADTLTVDNSGSEGLAFGIRMKSFVRPRCQPILFDPRINGWTTMAYNFYQIILVCAVKSVIYASHLERKVLLNAPFFVHCIKETILYAYRLVQRNFRASSVKSSAHAEAMERAMLQPSTRRRIMRENEALWLGKKAFQAILARQPKFHEFAIDLLDSSFANFGDMSHLDDIAQNAFANFQSVIL